MVAYRRDVSNLRSINGRFVFLFLLVFGPALAGFLPISGSNIVYAVTPATHVVINEFNSNPGAAGGNEWIELYNPTATTVDLTGWTIKGSGGRTINLPSGKILASKSYFVLNVTNGSLPNTNLSLTLTDKSGVIIDTTPVLSNTQDNRLTWARFPNGIDTNSTSDWRFQPGTPGASNGKFASTVSIAVNPTQINVFQSVTVTGAVNDTVVATLALQISDNPSFSNPAAATVDTNSNGAYSYSAPINAAGTHFIRAVWAGDDFHNGATSSTVTVIVNKLVTSIALQATPANVTLGNSVTVKGTLSPPIEGASIILTYANPNGTVHTRSVTTLSNGSFVDAFKIQTKGAWSVRASWVGDATHNQATSPTIVFNGVPRAAANIGLVLALSALAVAPAIVAVGFILGGRSGGVSRGGQRGAARVFAPRGPPRPPGLRARTPVELKPLKVGNGAICPVCFKPMSYQPPTASWFCEGCGRAYNA